MFKERVVNTALTTEEANNFFSGLIYGDGWAHDYSFVSTLRALVAPRMPDGDSINVRVFDIPSYSVKKSEGKVILENMTWGEGSIYILNIYNAREENMGIEDIESNVRQSVKGFQRVEKVTAFFHKVMGVLCYINPDKKTSVIIVDGLNLQKYHYLQCGTFAFLPWYFDSSVGCSDDEMAVLNSLREKTSDAYIKAIETISKAYDFDRSRIVRLLKGFETRYDKKQREQLTSRIEQILDEITNLDRRYKAYMDEKRDYEIRVAGLDKRILDGGDDNEIMDYFIHNRDLWLLNVDDEYMEFIAKGYLDQWSPEIAESALNNSKSFIYYDGYRDYNYSKVDRDGMKKLMSAIFIDETLKVRVCGAFRFSMGVNVEPMSGYSYGSEYDTYLPNPHTDRYNCMGNYLRIIRESVRNDDYILALEQTAQSARSLAFGDSVVMREFMCTMYRSDRKFIETPDGKILSPDEAVKWIAETSGCEDVEKGETDG